MSRIAQAAARRQRNAASSSTFRALRTDARYARAAAEIVASGLHADFPPPRRHVDLPRTVPASEMFAARRRAARSGDPPRR